MEDVAPREEDAVEHKEEEGRIGEQGRQGNKGHILDFEPVDEDEVQDDLGDDDGHVEHRHERRRSFGLLGPQIDRVDHDDRARHHREAEVAEPDFDRLLGNEDREQGPRQGEDDRAGRHREDHHEDEDGGGHRPGALVILFADLPGDEDRAAGADAGANRVDHVVDLGQLPNRVDRRGRDVGAHDRVDDGVEVVEDLVEE